MKVLIVGASGYIGSRLIPVLLQEGHHVVAMVRDKRRFKLDESLKSKITIIQGDLLQYSTLQFPKDCEAAYFLAHSMSYSKEDFYQLEEIAAKNFCRAAKKTGIAQLIYLSALNTGKSLSKHFQSRLNVESVLKQSQIPYTILRAGIVIGSGSASFEIIYDLVDKLPIMITPKWVSNRCQPIAIYDVLFYLSNVLGNQKCLDKTFDVAGPETLTYKEMMLQLANERGFKRKIIVVPVFTPRLSSYWLYFLTSTNYRLASTLVNSLKSEAIAANEEIKQIFPHVSLTYRAAIKRALSRDENERLSVSWRDAHLFKRVPKHPPSAKCIIDEYVKPLKNSQSAVIDKLWKIGGHNGWYTFNWAWTFRGFIDKLFGGIGLKRGRTDPEFLHVGDALDGWRVVEVDRNKGYLLLYSEFKLPGEAWLEFEVKKTVFIQKVYFYPNGLLGYMYWYALLPVHRFLFNSLIKALVS